jgi:succinate dehydrogenase/fumarate reductase flavoprotein subunit
MKITRRDFLKGTAAGALGMMASGLLGCAQETENTLTTAGETPAESNAEVVEQEVEAAYFEKTVDWDAEYDAVVIGFGGAGASVAITAADAGAKVLLVEKAPEGKAGGNSVVCMQWICGTSNKEETIKYIKALRGQFTTPSDEMIELYVDGMAENYDWIKSLGAEDPQYFSYCEFPELEGSDSFTPFTVAGNTGMSATSFGGDGAAYHLLRDNVKKRENITVWYEAEAKRLIQDGETKIVHGAVILVDGKEVNVRAKNGVVLACGGFENNKEMQQDFTQRLFWPSTGNAHYNTGDGIRMAMDAGADLWHMSNVVTNIEFYDEANQYATFAFQGTSRGIMVGPDATRFAAEDASRRHGKFNVSGTWENSPLPDYMYSIFDENGRNQGRLHFTWTEDSQEEIEKGWIVQADTIQELAEKVSLDAETLQKSIDKWNRFVDEGEDLAFGRTRNLVRIDTAPYYAVKITPCMGNTQGGPRKNEKGQVLTPYGEVIPHLYTNGELGDIWSNCYQASCNFGGGMIFGRIIGKEIAEAATDIMQDSVMNGKENYVPSSGEKTYELGENEYIGEGTGKGGTPIKVKVTMDGDTIVNIEVLEQSETAGISDKAFEDVIADILEKQTTDVDIVSGATLTSNGIIEAVADALAQVK